MQSDCCLSKMSEVFLLTGTATKQYLNMIYILSAHTFQKIRNGTPLWIKKTKHIYSMNIHIHLKRHCKNKSAN